MSNVNILRAIEHMRANTTLYTPIIECIVNSIQAIHDQERLDGHVRVFIRRSEQLDMYGGLGDVSSVEVEDNGVGFTDEHRESFDTLYTDQKQSQGGKGFGRLTYLKYFENVHVDSTYFKDDSLSRRTFDMGKFRDIIVNENFPSPVRNESGTTVYLKNLRKPQSIDKRLRTISRTLAEKLLPYLISTSPPCPRIVVSDGGESDDIVLNEFFDNVLSAQIVEMKVDENSFSLLCDENRKETFLVRVFKIYSPTERKSKVSLVAHNREVSASPLHSYVPEFIEEFYDKQPGTGEALVERNYIIKAYVFSKYLDDHVSLERGSFDFPEREGLFLISQETIEREAASIAREAVGAEIIQRKNRKSERVRDYVDQSAPWHKTMLDTVNLSNLPLHPTDMDIEVYLQTEKFTQEIQINNDVREILKSSSASDMHDVVTQVVSRISDTSKNDLIHYVALRRNILDIFERSLQADENEVYLSEGLVHDIIFPRKGDSDTTTFEHHNLWLIDERLNFTHWVSSDQNLNGPKTERPDLLVYNKRIMFREDNEPSNPVMIFEFKKPYRDNFVNASSKEDPVEQIIRYVIDIGDGKVKTPEKRKINISANTTYYGFVICDLTPKVETWLAKRKNFKPMPDGLGWFQWQDNLNLYIEVLSWDKVLKDAKMRNRVYFHALNIQ